MGRPCSRRGTLTTTLSTSRAREPMLRPMRLLLRHMPTLSHGMIPSTLIWSQRSSRKSLGSHLETNHSLYSDATKMSSTCLHQHPPDSHLKPLAKNISLNKNLSDMLHQDVRQTRDPFNTE